METNPRRTHPHQPPSRWIPSVDPAIANRVEFTLPMSAEGQPTETLLAPKILPLGLFNDLEGLFNDFESLFNGRVKNFV